MVLAATNRYDERCRALQTPCPLTQQTLMENAMHEKNCTSCNKLKPLPEFFRDKSSKDGFMRICKECNKIQTDAYRKTRDGLINSIYGNQRKNSKHRGHKLPDYSLKQLRDWAYSQSNFEELYSNWVESGYKKIKIPSIDRSNDYKPYTISNLLRICTWGENKARGHADMRNGINNKNLKAVHKLTSDGKFMAEYHSSNQASRETGVNQGCISSCCLGNKKSAGGFRWRFANLVAV